MMSWSNVFEVYSQPLFGTLSIVIAAALGMRGTSIQGSLARAKWSLNPNQNIVNAARIWAPGPKWIRRREHRNAWKNLESQLKLSPVEWAEYELLRREFYSWNLLETAVVIAFIGAVVPFIVGMFQGGK